MDGQALMIGFLIWLIGLGLFCIFTTEEQRQAAITILWLSMIVFGIGGTIVYYTFR